MIILFKENETKFDNLGIGVLSDATKCNVSESLNDSFELELEYPIFGQNYSEIKIDTIIYSKSSPTSNYQPFRVYSISKPLNGLVTIHAFHISYDMNGIIIGPISEGNLQTTLGKLESESLLPHQFKFYSNVQNNKLFKTNGYYNLRALLFGSEESILESYKLEIKFDNFNVYLMEKRGSDKNAEIRYGKNMTELEHEFTHDLLYNYVYPYYHKETSSQGTTVTSGEFKQAYIVGDKPLQDGWLSFEENGEPYHPVDEAPVQIATEGNYYKKVFTWDTTRQKYKERLVDQQITLVEDVIEPEWIEIDWSKFPAITVKARKSGYFKTITDTEYKHANVGDIVFTGSVRTITSNLILNYSEVIPPTESELNNVETSVTHTELSTKLLKVDTELANRMTFNRILNLDLTSEFEDDEEVNDATLTAKALKFIKENKIGQYKYNTTVSFADLSQTNENVIYKDLEKVELGDTIKVVYEALDINIELRVISTVYDALLDRYSSVELGDKSDTISSSSVQSGDSISSLKNDKGYTDNQQVSTIISKTITADYIEATNAKLSKAQIEDLQTARIKVSGMLEASQAEIDKLVAKMLIAENAVIKQTLEAGQIKVSGDISIKSGEIYITSEDDSKVFRVDREGNLYANSATIQGRIEAAEGHIGGFEISQTSIWNNIESMDSENENGVYIGPDGISLGKQLKIYPNGLIISHTNTDESAISQLLVPDEIKPQMRTRLRRSTDTFSGILLGSMTPSEVNNLTFTDFTATYVINISEAGTINNADGTSLSILKGDNITGSDVNSDNHIIWRKMNSSEFNNSYNYIDNASANTLNARNQVSYNQSGDICRILEDEQIANASEYDSSVIYNIDSLCIHDGSYYECLEDAVTGPWDSSKWSQINISDYHKLVDSNGTEMSVNVGDYVVFIRNTNPNDTWSWKWNKYYINNAYDPNYFGLTPEGILYANGAIISGDITVKSGEISIISSDGSKVFRVDRQGNLTATSATISGDITVTSGELNINNKFIVDRQGNLTATSATIHGTIEADEGYIAGFEILKTGYHPSTGEWINDNQIRYNFGSDSTNGRNAFILGIKNSNPKYAYIHMESKAAQLGTFSNSIQYIGYVDITPKLGVASHAIKQLLSKTDYPSYYDNLTTYNMGNRVKYLNSSYNWVYYECLENGTVGISPESDPTKWELIDVPEIMDETWASGNINYFSVPGHYHLGTIVRNGSTTSLERATKWYQEINFVITFKLDPENSSGDIRNMTLNIWSYFRNLYNIIGANVTQYIRSASSTGDYNPNVYYNLIETPRNAPNWNSSVTYFIGDSVKYNNKVYSSLKDNNLNHTPNGGLFDSWWKEEAAISTGICRSIRIHNGSNKGATWVTLYCHVLPYEIEESFILD